MMGCAPIHSLRRGDYEGSDVYQLLDQVGQVRIEHRFERPNGETVLASLCSGSVLFEDNEFSYVLTAGHCVDQRTSPQYVSSTFEFAGEEGELYVRGINLDYALLRIPNVEIEPLMIGDSSQLREGDVINAIGYPLGIIKNVSEGIVSNLSLPQEIDDTEGFMFTAAISPGSSGGPLFARTGRGFELVGIAISYYPRGNDMYCATGINQILEDIERQGIFWLHR